MNKMSCNNIIRALIDNSPYFIGFVIYRICIFFKYRRVSIYEKRIGVYSSIGRFIFYMLVVYGSVITGASIFLKASIYEVKYVYIVGLFLPYIFVYSMLFELADVMHFPVKLRGAEARKAHFRGDKISIGYTGVIAGVLFLISLYISIENNYLPVEVYPIALPLEFATVGVLFASKYHKLELKRSAGNYDLVGSITTLPVYYIVGGLFVFVLFASLRWENKPSYVFAVLMSIGLLFVFSLIILFFWWWNKFIRKSLNDKYFYEKPTVREILLQISICVVPYIVGGSSALYLITDNYWSVALPVFTSSKVLSTLLLILIFGVILENMRYVARYDESYFYRTINDITALIDKYKVSLNNFILLTAILFCFIPILLVLSDFEEIYICVFVLFVYCVIIMMINTLKPFYEMGCFNYTIEEKKKYVIEQKSVMLGVNKSLLEKYEQFYDKRIIPIFTPAHFLILLKVFSFVILLFGIKYGYINYQNNNVYFNQGVFVSENHNLKMSFIEKDLYGDFLMARYSNDYSKKKKFIQEINKNNENEIISDQNKLKCLYDALRMTAFQSYMFENYKEKKSESIFKNSGKNNAKIFDDKDFSNSVAFFVISAFLTIIVGLVLSSVFSENVKYNVAKKIVIGVFVQGLIVLALTAAFIQEVHYMPNIIFDADFIKDSIIYLISDGRYVITSYVYISLAFLLLTLVVFQQYIKNEQSNSEGQEKK